MISLNPAAERITGYRLPQAIGRHIDQLLPDGPSLVADEQDLTRASVEIALKIDRVEHLFDFQISPLHDRQGHFSGRIVVLRDVTERRQAEEHHWQLLREQAARAETEASIRARNELLSSISHDLKNPLAGIRAMSGLLQRRLAGPDRADDTRLIEGLARIDRMATRMATLLEEFTEVTRLEMGQPLNLERCPTDLIALAHRVVAEQQAAADHSSLRVETALPELIGDWDGARLERALTNLVVNAIKYSPRGGEIIVRVTHEVDAAGHWAVLSVRDQGIGIPATALPRIFERFYRAENVAGQIGGTGIGLASARQIVEQHGGTIGVDSQEGVGSTFTVRLPLARDQGSAIRDQG